MKAPIIVDNHGDTLIFDSLDSAEMYLEPIDVENKEYVAYDCEGRLLRLTPTSPRITIEAAEPQPKHAGELRALLSALLMITGVPQGWLETASLQQLLEKALKYKLE